MKALWFYKHVILWSALIAVGVLVPRLALSADCETQLKAAFQKKSVEMELQVISGEISDLEATGNREDLQAKMRKDSDRCNRRLAAARARAQADSTSF